jgi:hypothetical protein
MTAPKYPMPADWPRLKRRAFRWWARNQERITGQIPTWMAYEEMLRTKPDLLRACARIANEAYRAKAIARLTPEEREALERGEATWHQLKQRRYDAARREEHASDERIRYRARRAGISLEREQISADDRRRNAARAELSRMRVEALLRRRGIGR